MGYYKTVFMDMSESLGLSPAQLLEQINKEQELTNEEKEMAIYDHVSEGVEVTEEDAE